MLVFYLNMLVDENDRNLFEHIYYAYRKQMFTVALSVLGNEDDAEDAEKEHDGAVDKE